MNESMLKPKKALKYDTEVMEAGRVELFVPFLAGARISVFVIEETSDNFNDLLEAAQSSTNFWDNPYDDEDWNNV